MKNYLPRGAHAPIYPLIFSSLLALASPAKMYALDDSSAPVSTQGTLLSLTAVNSPILAALRRFYRITPEPIMLGNQSVRDRQRTLQALLANVAAVAIDMATFDAHSLQEHRDILGAAQRAQIPIVVENADAQLMAKMFGLGYTAPAVVIGSSQSGEHYNFTLIDPAQTDELGRQTAAFDAVASAETVAGAIAKYRSTSYASVSKRRDEFGELPSTTRRSFTVDPVTRVHDLSAFSNQKPMDNLGYDIQLVAANVPTDSGPEGKYLRIRPLGDIMAGPLARDSIDERWSYLENLTLRMKPVQPLEDLFLHRLQPVNANNVSTYTSTTGFSIGFTAEGGNDGAQAGIGIGFSSGQASTVTISDFGVTDRSDTANDTAQWTFTLTQVYQENCGGGGRHGVPYSRWEHLVQHCMPFYWGLRELPELAHGRFEPNVEAVWRTGLDFEQTITFELASTLSLRSVNRKSVPATEFRTYNPVNLPVTRTAVVDFGAVNAYVADTDNDGIPDDVEQLLLDPDTPTDSNGYPDSDGDGVADYRDQDSDGDGIFDRDEGDGDTDNDGIADYLDSDSDGDGFSDAEEQLAGSDPYDASQWPEDLPEPTPEPQLEGGLINISTNGFVDSSDMVAGFIVTGGPKRFVVMGENAGSLTDPMLLLTSIDGTELFNSNDNWRDHPTANEVELVLRAPGSTLDAAFAVTLDAGVYLARLQGKNGETGAGIVSVTDIDGDFSSGRLLNISTNGQVDRAGMVAGFIVDGPKRFVIMGENAGSLSNPMLTLTDLSGEIVYDSNDDWQDHLTANEIAVAVRMPSSLQDAAFAVTLETGVYLVRLEGVGGSTGTGIVSVTEISP
ncbi:MAG: hypothetical protein KDK04_01090 [Candidatus Competibacteraceae bacterium]|nr:hypothetical protein [Candidatus Competibacteraceae bacterium]